MFGEAQTLMIGFADPGISTVLHASSLLVLAVLPRRQGSHPHPHATPCRTVYLLLHPVAVPFPSARVKNG